MKNKFYYVGLNLIAPGLGQLSAKRYIRGAVLAILAIGSILWFAWEVIMPFIKFYNGDPLESELPEMNFINLLYPVLLFLIVLAWSIIDMFFGFKNNGETK